VELLAAINLAISKGILVVAVSQCIDSRVDLTAYALGRSLSDAGVVSGVDMTVRRCCGEGGAQAVWRGVEGAVTEDEARVGGGDVKGGLEGCAWLG
jgi:hypothetical protein